MCADFSASGEYEQAIQQYDILRYVNTFHVVSGRALCYFKTGNFSDARRGVSAVSNDYVTDFSAAEEDRGVKFCTRVGLLSRQVFSHFGGQRSPGTENALSAAKPHPACVRMVCPHCKRLLLRRRGTSTFLAIRYLFFVIIVIITVIIIFIIRPHHPYYVRRCGLLLPTE